MAGKYEFRYDLSGGNITPTVKSFPVAASQTLLAGDLVINSSGKVAIAGASTASVWGVMAEDSTSQTAGTMVRVYVAKPGQVWNTTADADASSHVMAGKTYDINPTTQTVDVGDTSNGCIQIVETVDSTTDVNVVFNVTELNG